MHERGLPNGHEGMLKLPKPFYEEMVAHCRREYPKEACGIFAGATTQGLPAIDRPRTVVAVYPMRNVEDSPIGYSMDPKEQLRLDRQMRQAGQQMLAIFHSHTATAAYPSSVDVSLAISPEISYVLVSLTQPQRPVVKSYRIDGTTVTAEEIVRA